MGRFGVGQPKHTADGEHVLDRIARSFKRCAGIGVMVGWRKDGEVGRSEAMPKAPRCMRICLPILSWHPNLVNSVKRKQDAYAWTGNM